MYKNKNSDKSNIFGDKLEANERKPIEESFLEGFARKQSIREDVNKKSNIINNKVIRSSTLFDNDSNSGEIFLGKNSSRSIFNPDSISAEALPESRSIKSRGFLPNEKKEVSSEIAEDLGRFKGNFNNASTKVGSHGTVRNDRISIFDEVEFSRIDEPKVHKAKTIEPEVIEGVSKFLSSKDLTSSLFDKLNKPEVVHKVTSRESAIDKLFGDKNGSV